MVTKRQNYSGTELRLRNLESFSISSSSHQPESRVRTHSHERPYLCVLLKGSYSERSSQRSETIDAGISIFRGAGYEHANRFFSSGGTCLNIEINDPMGFIDENDFRPPESGFVRHGNLSAYRLLGALHCGLSADELNILCYEAVFDHFDAFPVRGKLDWIRKIKERILDDPFPPISLTTLSREFDLNPNYIVRKFKEVTGYRLSQYLSKTRVEMALGKMLDTNETLTNIAVDSGFCDQSHFIRNFKNHIPDSTPKRFRKTLKRFV